MQTSFDEPVAVETVLLTADETKKCPFCAERIQAEAIKCCYCGEFLTGKTPPSMPKSGAKWYQSTATIVLALLTLGPLALPMVWTSRRYSLTVKIIITVVVLGVTISLCCAMMGMYRYIINQVQSLGIM